MRPHMSLRRMRIGILIYLAISVTTHMTQARIYRTFIHREAAFRICCETFDAVTAEIVRQRKVLEDYIKSHPDFQSSFVPLELKPHAPEVARRMAQAAGLAGVGPMAAVAGAMAQFAVEAGIKAGAREAIVDNGGDIYLQTAEPVVIGIYAGDFAPEYVKTFNVTVNYTGKGVTRNEESCVHCGYCIPYCPTDALNIENRATRQVIFYESKCIECLACVRICPYGACVSAF